MSFSFTPCPIPGLFEIQPNVFSDNRGYFFESYSELDFKAAGIYAPFVQDNQSMSVKGTLRGLHFQKKHPQGKLVRAIEGEIFDVAVDIKKDSPTFGKWYGIILSSKKLNQFYIPPGFAHGFLALTDNAIFSYKCTDFYYPDDDFGIIWNDPVIGIHWPEINMDYILSEKDKKLPLLDTLILK